MNTKQQASKLSQTKIKIQPKLKRVSKVKQRQQLLPGLQVGKQLAML